MVIVDAVPRDVHLITDFSLSDLKKLLLILDNMTFKFDGSISEHVEAKEYLENVFYPTVCEAVKEYTGGS